MILGHGDLSKIHPNAVCESNYLELFGAVSDVFMDLSGRPAMFFSLYPFACCFSVINSFAPLSLQPFVTPRKLCGQ